MLLTGHKLFEYYFLQNCLKVYDKMDHLLIIILLLYNVKHRYAIRMKSAGKLLTCPSKLSLEKKARICSAIKENLLLYCRKFSVFFAVVII